MNNNIPALIIINGASATGKTVIGQKISKEFNLPFINKDEYKELIFDHLGWSNLEWSDKVDKISFHILWNIAEKLLAAKESIIVETKFDPVLSQKDIEILTRKYEIKTFQILCYASGEELLTRFKKRALSDRHPGHCDANNLDKYDAELRKGKIKPIKISGKTIEIDTTDLDNIDYETIRNEIKKVLKG